jgi:GTP diphosphokinase / guanosine-3',5'-bis(diphosphate) 3'-diphosphatase
MEALKSGLLRATAYLPGLERERVARAFDVAEAAHRGVARKSGEPYITHPVAVAELLAEMQLDGDAIVAGLLHDTVEDTAVTFEEVEATFGTVVRRIVEGETKISKLAVRVYEDEQAENLRQMLLAMVGDVRIILVKLADRLHNMRTLAAMPAAKQQRIARETLEIFAPLAHRLGINHVKSELEDLAFSYLEPERYAQLSRQVRVRSAEREAYVEASIEALAARLRSEGLPFELAGRSKHLYSIHRKMLRDNKNLDQIFDLMAIRVVLDVAVDGAADVAADEEKAACYRALGIAHSLWTPIPGRFKDYVAVPKPNGYQSLHTTVIGPHGHPIEVQIRSRRMHEIAEYGVAAHWAYKQGIDDVGEVQKRLSWMQQLLEADTDSDSAGAFVDAVKADLLAERVLVFTPAGDVVNLPRGSTPLDFAYSVHTEIGHRCVGARVNGEIVTLGYALQTGDRIEVLTNRGQSYGPSPDWLQLATTRSARQKIRQWFRLRERAGMLETGRRMLERGLRRRQLSVAAHTTKGKLEAATRTLLKSDAAEDLFLALAAKRLAVKQAVDTLAPRATSEAPAPPPAGGVRKSIAGMYVEGMDAPAKLAQCCAPVRGDDVVGYITRGRGVSVHRVDCPNVKHLMHAERERFVDVNWEAPAGEVFAVDFEIQAIDRPGLLKDVLDVLAAMNKSATRVAADVQSASRARIHVRIDVKDQGEIEFVKQAVGRIADVTRVYRSRPGIKA